MENYVWYACYGSNINEYRFSYYIKGGKYLANGSDYVGCRNKSDFIAKTSKEIKHELYFAEKSASWEGKAVAFITANSNDEYKTKCTLYKVTTEQFIDIFLQENGKDPMTSIITPEILKDLKSGEEKLIGVDNDFMWYGRLIQLENHQDGCPVYTFTSKTPDSDIILKEPGAEYLKVIAKGVFENFNLSESKVTEYLYNSKGIKESSWSKERIGLLFQKKFKVVATGLRNAPRGEFVAQLNEDFLNENNLVAGVSEVVISYNIEDTPHVFKTLVKIQKYPEQDTELADGFIALDQTIRDAIGCDKEPKIENKKNEKLNEKDYTVSVLFPRHNLFTRLKMRVFNLFQKLTFDKQLNIVRVFKATPNDMEINICRLGLNTMQSIGIEDGDKVKVKSVKNKIKIRALTMNEVDRADRKKSYYIENEGGCEKLKKLSRLKKQRKLRESKLDLKGKKGKKGKKEKKLEEDLKAESLAMIFLDLDARQELGIVPGDSVTIYRSNWFAILKNIHAITIPILLAIFGIGLNLNGLLKCFEIELVANDKIVVHFIFYVACSIILILVNLTPIRNKFK